MAFIDLHITNMYLVLWFKPCLNIFNKTYVRIPGLFWFCFFRRQKFFFNQSIGCEITDEEEKRLKRKKYLSSAIEPLYINNC